jgi:hypothetical protein
VARSGEDRTVYKVLVEKLEGKNHSEDRGVDGRMWPEWILGLLVGGCGVEPTVSGKGPVVGSYECSGELSGSSATGLVRVLVILWTEVREMSCQAFFVIKRSPEKSCNGTHFKFADPKKMYVG